METDNARACNPTASMRFRWPWRDYQIRVLNALEAHLADDRLHVVAAPGSGKTTLGLELFRHIGKPVVVLSPTRIIRDQWIKRLQDFLPEHTPFPPNWASRDLDQPGFLTSLTYQALHTRYRLAATEEDEEAAADDEEALESSPTAKELQEVVKRFQEIGIGALICDEAHHLRRGWWKALADLLDQLGDVKLIALTATPPYDVVGLEWRRYEELCGHIDEEISVPELVKTGTLCPHQDYIWTVEPREQDVVSLRDYDKKVRQLTNQLLADSRFMSAVSAHAWVRDSTPDPTQVLEQPELATAILVYLKTRGQPLPQGLLRLLHCDENELPAISRRWWQVLVREYLFGTSWILPDIDASYRKQLMQELRSAGLLWRRELRLEDSRPVKSQLTLTGAKIDACVELWRLERQVRGDHLRMVILTDFIRDDGDNQLGAWPIFRAMIDESGNGDVNRFALLTGRLALVHRDRWDSLRKHAPARASYEPLESHPSFVRVSAPGGRGGLVAAFTRLFSEGQLHLMIGTRALLGEGWDAPAINSLVLASYVGSFMLTNQMRGRAIRTDRKQPHKVSSIWHLCAVDPASESGFADMDEVARRFETFVGLAASAPRIEGGIQRLDLPPFSGPESHAQWNQVATQRLSEVHQLHERWREAIVSGDHQRVLPGIHMSNPPSMRAVHFPATLKYLLASATSTFVGIFSMVLQNAEVATLRQFAWILLVASAVGLMWSLPKFVRAGWAWLRHLPVDGSLRQIALALQDAIGETELIRTPTNKLSVRSEEVLPGQYSISLAGGTFYEAALFADCLEEILGPIENPRYLLSRDGRRQTDYHAVPQILATRKELANTLHRAWLRRVGPSELFYTRHEDGRLALLSARARAFSTVFCPTARRRDRWQ